MPMSSPLPPDPYEALGVHKDAELPAIRTAHRKLVLKLHPDRLQDPALKESGRDEFQKIQQAYELLSDPIRRSRYDDKIKLAELRRDAMMRYTVPRPAYPSRHAASATAYPAASREWDSEDETFYEFHRPKESYFDSKERLEKHTRTNSRKYPEYDRSSIVKKAPPKAPKADKSKASARGASVSAFVSAGVKIKAEVEKRKESKRAQEERYREKRRAREEKERSSRRTYVETYSDSDTATRVTREVSPPDRSNLTRTSREEKSFWGGSRQRASSVQSRGSSRNHSLRGRGGSDDDYKAYYHGGFQRARSGSGSDYGITAPSPGLPPPPASRRRDTGRDRDPRDRTYRSPDRRPTLQRYTTSPQPMPDNKKFRFPAPPDLPRHGLVAHYDVHHNWSFKKCPICSQSPVPNMGAHMIYNHSDHPLWSGPAANGGYAVGPNPPMHGNKMKAQYVQQEGPTTRTAPDAETSNDVRDCYICGQALTIKRKRDWQTHVLADLKPYQCLEQSCAQAEDSYGTVKSLRQHYLQHHPLATVMKDRKWRCFCGENIGLSIPHRFGHVGRHMEEIAFATVPRQYEDWQFYNDSSTASDTQIEATPLAAPVGTTAAPAPAVKLSAGKGTSDFASPAGKEIVATSSDSPTPLIKNENVPQTSRARLKSILNPTPPPSDLDATSLYLRSLRREATTKPNSLTRTRPSPAPKTAQPVPGPQDPKQNSPSEQWAKLTGPKPGTARARQREREREQQLGRESERSLKRVREQKPFAEN